jgi:outer membrane protein OmpA-like peptidoglycan-associated protein
MRRIFTILIIGLTAISFSLQAQKVFFDGSTYSTDPIDPKNFNEKLFQDVMLYKINRYMDSLGLEGFEAHEFFMKPAREHAIMMAESQDASLEGKGAYRTVRDRLIAAGGTGIGAELVSRMTIRVSNEYLTYDALASQVMDRWVTGKFSKDLFSQKYFFAGVSGKVDESEKKIFISMYMGNYASFKPSTNPVTAGLPVPITTKTSGLKPYDESICKKTGRRMPNIVDLQSGLSINDQGQIIFKYNDLKKFRKFIKDSKDGLAVDIIQKEQFNNCRGENIADYTTVNQGVLTKRIYSKKLYKSNIAQGEGKRNKVTKLEVVLGNLPVNLRPEDVELNLVIIKNKSVCHNIPQSWVDKKIYDFVPKLGLLPDTVLPAGVPEYAPTATSTELRFRIPFEQGKYDYKPEDMKPVLAALNEPDFIINKIFITAYSSLEGSIAENAALQKKRAQSIVKALEQNQNASIVDSIVTQHNLKDLQNDARGTIYDAVCTMNLEEAVRYVNARAKEMEFLLENHRYADIVMWVTYDIEGSKEQKYVVDQFNKAVAANQLNLALSIQKYILKRVVEGRYTETAVTEMRIPQGKQYVGLNMNKIWLTQFIYMDPLDEEYQTKINDLYKLDNQNLYVDFNDILCSVMLSDLDKPGVYDNIQRRIDRLYNTPIRVEQVDRLNIELQFQIMSIYKDSLGIDHPVVTRSLDKIKEIVKIDKVNWETALKLASIFINQGDYQFAIYLLEPFMSEEKLPLVFYTTYATVCSKIPYKTHSNNFLLALEKIKKEDPKYFCDLFKGDKFSVQTFVNTRAKDIYCKTCKK